MAVGERFGPDVVQPGLEEFLYCPRTSNDVAVRHLGHHRGQLALRSSLAGTGPRILGIDGPPDLDGRAVGATACVDAKPAHSGRISVTVPFTPGI
jgi:hypothetical protein